MSYFVVQFNGKIRQDLVSNLIPKLEIVISLTVVSMEHLELVVLILICKRRLQMYRELRLKYLNTCWKINDQNAIQFCHRCHDGSIFGTKSGI